MLTILCFFDPNSSVCKVQNSFMNEIEQSFSGIAEIKRINVLAEKELSRKYNIAETPAVIIENNGTLKERFNGLTQPLFLRRGVERALGKR